MADQYTAPPGDKVNFLLAAKDYTPPQGDKVNFLLGAGEDGTIKPPTYTGPKQSNYTILLTV